MVSYKMKGLGGFGACFMVCSMLSVQGLPSFPSKIPNANNVIVYGVKQAALGHKVIDGSTSASQGFNKFGLDFHQNGDKWENICDIDSDDDGLTNGEELCDPGCLWTEGDADPVCPDGVELSHPGLGGETPAFIYVHMAMMTLAWLLLAPVGILLVVVKKKTGSWWLDYHRGIMIAVTVITLVGFFVIGAPLGFSGIGLNTHRQLGIVVIIFSVLQPISGFLRPHVPQNEESKSSLRLLWEIQHQWLGRISFFLAMGAIITGIPRAFDVSQEVVAYSLGSLLGLVTVLCFAYVICLRDKEKYKNCASKHEGTLKTDIEDNI